MSFLYNLTRQAHEAVKHSFLRCVKYKIIDDSFVEINFSLTISE
jgi:hypothetical protein